MPSIPLAPPIYATHLSLFAIPAAWVIALLPHVYAVRLITKYDKTCPRDMIQQVNAKATKSEDELTFLRAEAAQQNGFENVPLFAVAVLSGNVAGLPAPLLNGLAAFYLASRVAYNLLYIRTRDTSKALYRTFAFLGGIGCCFTLLVRSALVFNRMK